MRKYSNIAWCAVMAIAPALAIADTLHLKDGTSLDGAVVKINDNCMAIRSGNGEIVYSNDEIDRVEKNEKKGTLDLAVTNPAALRHEQELEKATGLIAEQREKIIAIVDRLAHEDAAERSKAVKELIALNQQLDIYRFLKESRQGFGARVLPGVLEVMLALNKGETKPIVLDCLNDKSPPVRAAALELLGTHKELASLETVARGLVDSEDEVQIASAHALAALADKRATPALIASLGNANPRVRNAALAALSRVWGTAESPVQFETADEWTKFWNESSAQAGKPIELAALEPLYIMPEGTNYVIVHE
ncbi:MAG: HEAT repeat domain-containing protein [Candidatus Hydrogenedentes bacterium]|nr:HEAT repeat domain-containing protein [Candidatus Hydrogenedentota bacterium]